MMDKVRIEAAKAILSGPSCLLYKPCRAGATTSLAVAAVEQKKSLLLVAPTNKILDETLKGASSNTSIKIAANSFCLKWAPAIKNDPFLLKLPLPIQECKECVYFQICDVTEIIRSERKPGEGISYGCTYNKLTAVMLSKSDTAISIREKLYGLDCIVLDEAHLIGLHRPPNVLAFSTPDVPEEFTNLRGVLEGFQDLCNQYIEIISELQSEGSKGHAVKHLSRFVPVKNPVPFGILSAAWNELIRLAGQREELDISEDSILVLRDMCSIMGGYWCSFGYVSELDGETGRVYVIGNVGIVHLALRDFLSSRDRTVKIFTSGTMLEPYPKFFEELAGCKLENEVFPEVPFATRKMRIIPDRWTLDSRNFNRRFDFIVSRIMEICEEWGTENCFVIAPTEFKADRIKRRLSELMSGMRPDVDYYRSDKTIGVERGERICIAIGLAHVPSNSYDHLARGENPEERAISSASIRTQSVHSATWQAWNRVKDPAGKRESRIYCIGIRARQALDVATWGIGRRMELIGTTETTYGETATGARKAKAFRFKVIVDKALDLPLIEAEPRSDRRAGLARPDLMVMSILRPEEVLSAKLYADNNENILKACEDKLGLCYMLTRCTRNRENALYINNRVFSQKAVYCVNTWHGIFSGYEEDREKVAAFLALYFCHRTDFYAFQVFNKQAKKWNFINTHGDLNDYAFELIKKHLRADVSGLDRRFTMGVYQIDPEKDTVAWICFDFDRHNPTDPDPKSEVQKLLAVLEKYSVPYLLEASGSPDSYHVWIFLEPTMTRNAYFFSRLLKKVAKVDCEVWPKQQSYSGRSGKDFGNLVKLPLAFHNKTGRRSCFLDPETFEPLEEITFPGLVRLFEQPKPVGGVKPKPKSKSAHSEATIIGNADFRPCLKGVLESGQTLEGSEGHEMRVDIAIEAKCAGMSVDEAVNLFRNLPDFNETVTRGHVKNIYSHSYKRRRCDTILDKSKNIILPHCQNCCRPWASENVEKSGHSTRAMA